LAPYSCARDEFKGEARVFVDANENPFPNGFNRYPDPLQLSVKESISKIKNVRPTQIMLGNGSDEPIDLIYRIFCEPKVDNAVAIAPSYGMYGVCADINDVEYRTVRLNDDFSLNADAVLKATDERTHVIWLCSPNNPSGNLLNRSEIKKILDSFDGIVVIDEAYQDFAAESSWLTELDKYPQLIVLQTFSKAWGMAGVRCGMAFASEEIIAFFNKVKYPYNVNILTQKTIAEALSNEQKMREQVKTILDERAKMQRELAKLGVVKHIFPSDANFLLVRVTDAPKIYKALADRGCVVRSRHNVVLCENCLRITIGTPEENEIIINELKTF
jgi:histidinol-phosphate aminotransferase